MKKLLGLFAFSAAALVGHVASAQPFPTLAKDTLPNCVKSIANGGGATFAIGCSSTAEGSVWTRSATAWTQFSAMGFKQITVSGAGVPWGLKADGTVWKWSTAVSSFQQKGQAGTCASEIAAGATDNDVWALGCDPQSNKSIWRFNGSVFNTPQPNAAAAHIAIGSNSALPWALTDGGAVYKWNGSTFGAPVPGCASAIGGNGWAVGCDRKSVWLFGGDNAFHAKWSTTNGPALVSIGSNGLVASDVNGSALIQGNLTQFSATGFQTPVYALSVTGNGFTPSKTFQLFYDNPVQGAIALGVSFLQSKADGSISRAETGAEAHRCENLRMHNTSQYSVMPLRMVTSDGETTYFSSSAIFNACRPFLPL